MNRVKTFAATGVAPNGKLYAGDLNSIQDAAAALTDFAQTISLGTLRIGEAGLQMVRFGTGEARVTGALRTDGILRGLGGILPGTFTTAQRDAIPAGGAPYGVALLNSTTNQWEWNKGSDGARNWQPIGLATVTSGDLSAGSVTNSKLADGSVSTTKIADFAVTDIKLAANSVYTSKIVDGNVTPAKLTGFPSTPVTIVAGATIYVFGSPNSYSITVPATGTYIVEWGTNHYDTQNTNASSYLNFDQGGSAISPGSNNDGSGLVGPMALTAGQVLTFSAQHASGASAGAYSGCWAKLTRIA